MISDGSVGFDAGSRLGDSEICEGDDFGELPGDPRCDSAGGSVFGFAAPRPLACHPVEFEAAPDLAWCSCLTAQGIVAAIVVLTLPPPIGGNHAYLIGFDEARGNPELTRHLLAHAEAVWSRPDVTAAQPETCGALPLDAGSAFVARLGPAFAIHTQVNGVAVRGLFFKAAGAPALTRAERSGVDKLVPIFVEHGLVRANLSRQAQQTAMLEAMFDRVSLPMLLMDADCRPLFTNAAAEAMMAERRWLLRNPDGAIGCPNAAATRELRAAVRHAAGAGGAVGGQDVVRIDGPSGDWRLVQIVPPSPRQCGSAPRSAMMIVLSPGKVDASPLLLQALGLLPSEQKFLGRFLRSSNIGDAASGCGISEETARTYLKRVRSKLGVSRQMELASLISSLALPLHDSAPAPALADAGDIGR